MARDGDVRAVLEIAGKVSTEIAGLTWYGFGSCFLGKTDYNDIDVLVVCRSVDDAVTVRNLVQKTSNTGTLHLLAMTYEEEEETQFVARQACIPFSGLSASWTGQIIKIAE